MAAAQGVTADRQPKAIIVPHAGYVYSGPIAAGAYCKLRIEARRFSRVVVMGPAHFVPVTGIVASKADAFETPLGQIPVDRSAIEELRGLRAVTIADKPHRPEHAVETQLPFLQRVLGEFALVPLMVGNVQPIEVAEVLGRLWGGTETLPVVSSDLSHYHDYETARRRDAATAGAIERYQYARLGPEDACGFLPIAGLLYEAHRRGLVIERLELRNSGDTAGLRDRVVGYGAWALYGTQATSRPASRRA